MSTDSEIKKSVREAYNEDRPANIKYIVILGVVMLLVVFVFIVIQGGAQPPKPSATPVDSGVMQVTNINDAVQATQSVKVNIQDSIAAIDTITTGLG